MKLNDYEIRHNGILRRHGAECTVLLKKDGRFPLRQPCPVALYGNGARNTVKGGDGSGEVNSRFFVNIESGLKEAGFSITTTEWLDRYDEIAAKAKKKYIRDVKEASRKKHMNIIMASMGVAVLEPEYEIALNGEGDTAVYVLARNSGEGKDRVPAEGDIRLTRTEIRDILLCSEKYENFMLVINSGGVVDLSPVREVKNILLLSQLGVETGHIFSDILLGKQNPSGKLTTTWTATDDYPAIGDFEKKNDTNYREGIYVGYRYFDSVGKRTLFPFGYGISYTSFSRRESKIELSGSVVKISVKLENTGSFPGKAVVQAYVSAPAKKYDKPYQELAAFRKTGLLEAGESGELRLSFDMLDMASFDEAGMRYVLESGDYLIRLGEDSVHTDVIGVIRLDADITVKRVRSITERPDFEDFKPDNKRAREKLPEGLTVLTLQHGSYGAKAAEYEGKQEPDDRTAALDDDLLIKMNLGAFDPKGGMASIIGNAGFTVAGAAGQTSLEVKRAGIESLVMADGPAGLRLDRDFVKTPDGVKGMGSPIPASMLELLPKIVRLFMRPYKPKKGETVQHQYATALPIGTAVAQSFNVQFAEACGDIVGDEMERFGVNLWLAPALNIHRNIRCGRNFEYFSEDPLVSGEFAAAITRGVQKHPGCGTTLKHFACNNQEYNRTQNNSVVSERALREIYLKGFSIAIRKSSPKAIMTSYNLINGVHTSESRELIEGFLRAENGYGGIVMTDWVVNGYASEKACRHPVADASKAVMAGNDLFMPGSKFDYDAIKRGMEKGSVSREQLRINAARVLKLVGELLHS